MGAPTGHVIGEFNLLNVSPSADMTASYWLNLTNKILICGRRLLRAIYEILWDKDSIWDILSADRQRNKQNKFTVSQTTGCQGQNWNEVWKQRWKLEKFRIEIQL